MAKPRITWNANALNFPNPLTGYRAGPRSRRFLEMSDGKVHATQVRATFDEIRVELANFDDAEFEAALHAWWAWAKLGEQYAFSLDPADQVDTTLDAGAAAGQKVIPLTATTGIVVGTKYRLRQAAGHNEEVVHVDSISAGVSVTARDNLLFTYASGDLFRSRGYFPKVVATEDDFPVVEHHGATWTFAHTMREDAA